MSCTDCENLPVTTFVRVDYLGEGWEKHLKMLIDDLRLSYKVKQNDRKKTKMGRNYCNIYR